MGGIKSVARQWSREVIGDKWQGFLWAQKYKRTRGVVIDDNGKRVISDLELQHSYAEQTFGSEGLSGISPGLNPFNPTCDQCFF